MAYTDDAVLAKLSALNETQESIVTVAQWVMFHRRHADRTGQLWLQRLKESNSGKRLNLIYLANEVVQQSKARRKDDFWMAFSPVIAEATATAYKGASYDVQQKLRRVVEVWRQRNIFEGPIQDAIEARIDELDKNRVAGKAGVGGGGIFGKASSTPKELEALVAPQQQLAKLSNTTKTSVSTASSEYEKLTDPAFPIPSAPVYAARLNGLLKTLATAEGAVAESIKARTSLVSELEKLLAANRTALETEQKQFDLISGRKNEIDNKKREVEDSIMRGFATNSNPTTPKDGTPKQETPGTPKEVDRPEMEALTPPSYEPLSPIRDAEPSTELEYAPPAHNVTSPPKTTAGLDLLASLSTGTYGGSGSGSMGGLNGHGNGSGIGSNKKRKIELDDFPDLGADGIDDDVAAMLREGR